MTTSSLILGLKLTRRMVIIALVAVAALARPTGARAAELKIEQAFPRDSMAYFEADLTGGYGELLDYGKLAAAGAVGMGWADLAELLRGPLRVGPKDEMPIGGPDIEALVKGMRRIGVGLIDVVMGDEAFMPTLSWLAVIEHQDARVLTDLLNIAAQNKTVIFERNTDIREAEVWSLQFPEDWYGNFAGLFNPRAFWRWNAQQIDRFSDPLHLSVWDNRFIVLSSDKSEVLDAVEKLEFPEDASESLAGYPSFRDFRTDTRGDDFAAFWNVYSTIIKVERLSGSMGMDRDFTSAMYSVAEVKQFRSLIFSVNYAAETGDVRAKAKLSFFNRPSWVEVLPFEPKPTPLTSFCPRRPSFFASLSAGSPKSVWDRIRKLIGEKSEAAGAPDAPQELEKELKELETSQGFSLDEVLDQIGGEHAVLALNPWLPQGVKRRGAGMAVVVSVIDEARAREFITTKLLPARSMRPFFHVNERATVETPTRGQIMYHVFSSGTSDSFAWVLLDGCLVVGNQDAVRAVIHARTSGQNLESDPEWAEFQTKLPALGAMTTFSDLGFLSDHATSVFPNAGGATGGYYDDWGDWTETEIEDGSESPDELSLPGKVFTKHIRHLRVGTRLVLEGNSIELVAASAGLPGVQGAIDLMVTSALHEAWRNSRTQLLTKMIPAVEGWMVEHGDLPESRDEFVQRGGEASVFRDPMLAGPSVRDVKDDHSFVWLGKHGTRKLLPAVPLAHSKQPGENGKFLLLMSDSSVHRITPDQLERAVSAASDASVEPEFKSKEPQNLAQLLDKIKEKREGESKAGSMSVAPSGVR